MDVVIPVPIVPPPEESPRSWLCCCTTFKDRSKFERALINLPLATLQKDMFRSRYIGILENFQKRARNHAIVYFVGHFVITVGSLFVPALLSIQNSNNSYVFGSSEFAVHIYWATFIISLLVTIFNGILTLFKIDKKYYFLHTTLEKLRSEGWQYIGLTGRYAGQLLPAGTTATHENQFLYFSHAIEKIKMRQVEEEYYKTDEHAAHAPPSSVAMNGNGTTAINKPSPIQNIELYPPSPNMPLPRQAPPPINKVVRSIIRSQPVPFSRTSSRVTLLQPNPLSQTPSHDAVNDPDAIGQPISATDDTKPYHRSDPLVEDPTNHANYQGTTATVPVSSIVS